MKTLRRFVAQVRGLFGGERGEEDFDAEMESHVAMHVEDNVRAGMDAGEARRQALLKLGGLEQARQARREGRTLMLVENLLQDLRFAARQLLKNKGFAITAIFILSLGICANVAIFSFVDAALIKPLPYAQPSRLMSLFESNGFGKQYRLSYPDYMDWKTMSKSFQSMAVYMEAGYVVKTAASVELGSGMWVSDGFFRTLGVRPVLGRDFYEGEDLRSAPRTVLLSYKTWQQKYGGRSDALGQTVHLNDFDYVVIGVLPKGFSFPPVGEGDYWTTLHLEGDGLTNRSSHSLYGIARLKDGVNAASASAEIAGIARQLERQYPNSNRGRGGVALALTEVMLGSMREILLTLLGGAGLLLAIVCVNVASLLLVRSENRRRETAIRTALGASRARLLRQFMTEGMLLTTVGAVLGVGGAWETMHLMQRLIPAEMLNQMPYLRVAGLNLHVLLFAVGIAAICGLLFVLVPMLRLPAKELQQELMEGSRGSAGTLLWRKMGANLVVIELAIAVVLLAGAGLLGKSFYRLLHVETGIVPEHVAAIRLGAYGDLYNKDEQRVALVHQLLERVQALPGVESAGIVNWLPLGIGSGANLGVFNVTGMPDDGVRHEANMRNVSPTYFSTMKARLVRGRYFTETEDASKPRTVIINEALARQYFAGENPLGKHLTTADGTAEIVGVVGDIREGQLDLSIRPAIYAPYYQNPDHEFALAVRSELEPHILLKNITNEIHAIDPALIPYGGTSMTEIMQESQTAYLHRSSAWLVGGFATVALLLGVVGIYGVIAYSVSQRTREIGVRMALGAQRSEVSGMILREAGWLVAAGVVLGVACSLGAGRLMGSLLFGVSGWDVPTLAGVAAVLSVAAMLASFLPALRAARVDPVVALRAE
ncbi:MAG TPA: ABC transporter permease [Edaphobacter sp.]|nr:ABC transporter permease [Edaphobacter sp.]